MRGMRTLHVRIAAQMANAGALAQRLSAHPAVAQVLYPACPSIPVTRWRRAR